MRMLCRRAAAQCVALPVTLAFIWLHAIYRHRQQQEQQASTPPAASSNWLGVPGPYLWAGFATIAAAVAVYWAVGNVKFAYHDKDVPQRSKDIEELEKHLEKVTALTNAAVFTELPRCMRLVSRLEPQLERTIRSAKLALAILTEKDVS